MRADEFRKEILGSEGKKAMAHELRLSGMKDMYKGRMGVVMGGGPSLEGDLVRLGVLGELGGSGTKGSATHLEGALHLAVNWHAWEFVEADFMVYNDPPAHDPEMEREVARHRCVLVTPDTREVGQGTGDVVFDVENVWTGMYSSNTATWFALWLGCDPVVLCGMDCYQGEVKYAHPWKHHPALDAPLDVIIRPWKEDGRHLEGVERVRVMSGPLVEVFGKWEPGR